MSLHAKIMALKPPAYYKDHEQLRRIGFFDGAEKAAELAAQHDAVMEQMANALNEVFSLDVALLRDIWGSEFVERASAAIAAHAEVTK